MSALRTFAFRTHNGTIRSVRAEFVTFEPTGHVAFWTGDPDDPFLVLALHGDGVGELQTQVGS